MTGFLRFFTRRRLGAGLALAWVLCCRSATVPSEWHEEPGCRWSSLPVPKEGKTGFSLLGPEATGIAFTNLLDVWEGEANRVLANGSGVAVGDYDGDGLPDIYLCSLSGRNRLFHNVGSLHFEDATEASGIVVSNRYCRGAVFADVDGDGKLDLLVATTGNGVLCFVNRGGGRFSDETAAAGTATTYGSVTLALADVDGDGTPDLYVVNNRTDDIRDRGELKLPMVSGKLQVPPELKDRIIIQSGRLLEFGEPSQFYLNDGRGHFRLVPWTNGVFATETGVRLSGPPLDWGLTAAFRDVNGDGWPDLYVCNDYWTPDRFWINDGHGRFRLAPKLALRNTSGSSMGVDFADIDRSGGVDFFVADMLSRNPRLRRRQVLAQAPAPQAVGAIDNRPQFLRNTLQKDRGDGTWAEIANFAGVAASEWSWTPLFMDVDLDGYPDLLVTAGHIHDVQDLDAEDRILARKNSQPGGAGGRMAQDRLVAEKVENVKLYPPLDMPVAAFHNRRGYRFEDVTDQWGTDAVGVHHALAVADFDGDGDLDFIVNNLGAAAGLYRNNSVAPRVAVRLAGRSPNTQGIGAKVTLRGGGGPDQTEEVVSGGRYMSGSDPQLMFAVPDPGRPIALEVRWRDGSATRISDVVANRLYEVRQGPPAPEPAARRAPSHPLFEDVTRSLGHAHTDEAFADFDRQPLLPRKLSQLGPGVAWGDLSGSGRDDLVISSGKGGATAVFRNLGAGRFVRDTNGPWGRPCERDAAMPLIWAGRDGSRRLLVSQSHYEDGMTNSPSVESFGRAVGDVGAAAAGDASAAGAMALADYDGDGVPDLFVAGRVLPGQYPAPASSRLFRGDGAGFVLDPDNSRRLEGAGMVTGAVWTDLDGDGYPELVLACEWGPIKVFHNDHGRLEEATRQWGLDRWPGWWTGIAAGDFDGDGKMDLAAGNWGENSPYQASPTHPERLYYGDFAKRGAIDLVEAEFTPSTGRYESRRQRTALAAALPDLAQRFPTHLAFSQAPIESVLGDLLSTATRLDATTLKSTVFLNRGGRFEALPLPAEAQWAPVYGVVAGDWDGDGREDLFLAQNFFENQPETPRCDAGRGLILMGAGDGTFRPMPGQASGVLVYGEQRGAATADFDGDGRADLVVTENGAATRLFRNREGRAGVRVRLAGSAANPQGIGAVIRGKSGDRPGPAHEVHAGGGYWSQDSAVVVVSGDSITSIEVAWPGPGRQRTETAVPQGVLELTIGRPDKP